MPLTKICRLLLLYLAAVPAGYAVRCQEIQFGTGSWDAASLGNHRAVIEVREAADAVWAQV